jgi:endonuclease/exonuclease/phosphatase family metal-dependent hydrolase
LLRSTERGATHAQVNRPLLDEFSGWLADRPWELALLQEAPPRWLARLGRSCRADGAIALTSRNLGSALRGAAADWNPDLLASNEGGSNQLLVRHPGRIVEVRRMTLARFPERRRMLFARIETTDGCSLCAANLHASAGRPEAASSELLSGAEAAIEWAGSLPLVFGGDFNVRPGKHPAVFELLATRYGLSPPTGPNAIDHILARGMSPIQRPTKLRPEEREVAGPDGLRIRLSDHDPVTASFGMK